MKIRNVLLIVFVCLWAGLFADDRLLQVAKSLQTCSEDPILIQKLSGGLTNENYKVQIGSSSYFFRCNNNAESILGCSLEREYQITKALSDSSIAPKVIAYRPENGILVTDFIKATAPVNLCDKNTLEKFCILISSLHHLKIEFPTEYDPYVNIESYLDDAIKLGFALPEVLLNHIIPKIRSFSFDFKTIKVPSHLDLHAGNLLDDGNQLWLIDWEYAAMADPFFDLATLASASNFCDQEMKELIACYLARTPSSEEVDYFHKMRILADVRWALWCYIQAKISPLDEPFQEMGNEYLQHCLERIGQYNAGLQPAL